MSCLRLFQVSSERYVEEMACLSKTGLERLHGSLGDPNQQSLSSVISDKNPMKIVKTRAYHRTKSEYQIRS